MFGFRHRSRRVRKLEEVLGWYADESHWRRTATNPKGSPRRWKKSAAARDRGARARQVLQPWSARLWNTLRFYTVGKLDEREPRKPTVPAALPKPVQPSRPSDALPLVPATHEHTE